MKKNFENKLMQSKAGCHSQGVPENVRENDKKVRENLLDYLYLRFRLGLTFRTTNFA